MNNIHVLAHAFVNLIYPVLRVVIIYSVTQRDNDGDNSDIETVYMSPVDELILPMMYEEPFHVPLWSTKLVESENYSTADEDSDAVETTSI